MAELLWEAAAALDKQRDAGSETATNMPAPEKGLFCGLKCHSNFATHGAWRSAMKSRGRYSFSV